MKIAAIYDIHGNLPALEAVLAEIKNSGVDQIVAGGDVILGPMSRECLDVLLNHERPIHFIKGNCESAVLAQMFGDDPGPLPDRVLQTVRWTAKQLSVDHYGIMSKWPGSITIGVPGMGDILFCHATPKSDNDCFTRLTPEHKLLPVFEELEVETVVCGHTHMQFDRVVGHVRILNAGSVGMPFGKPGAYWLLIERNVEFQHTEYDLKKAAKLISETSYPEGDEFANKYILSPPSEEEMLEIFSKIETSY